MRDFEDANLTMPNFLKPHPARVIAGLVRAGLGKPEPIGKRSPA
jgi:hypothetical protein